MRQTTDPTQTKCSDCSGGSACATELEFLGCAIYFWTRAKNTDLRIWILIRFGGLGTQCCSFAEVHSLWAEVGDKRCTLSLSPSTTGRNIFIFSFFFLCWLWFLQWLCLSIYFLYSVSIFCLCFFNCQCNSTWERFTFDGRRHVFLSLLFLYQRRLLFAEPNFPQVKINMKM